MRESGQQDDEAAAEGDEHGIIDHLTEDLKITGRREIVRRDFAMEVYDGVLPILAIVVTGLITISMQDSFLVFETILLASLATGVAHFMAGFGGSYLVDSAEGSRIVEQVEMGGRGEINRRMKLSHFRVGRAERHSTLFLALVDGVTPLLSILLVISPMVIALFGVIDHMSSLYASIFMGLLLLAVLGIYLGNVAKENVTWFAAKTLAAGLLTMMIMVALTLITESRP
ncbi:MAG: hypothetical protein ACE5H4_09880 [Candidatus Thorarchaeota archaeon]